MRKVTVNFDISLYVGHSPLC